MRIRNCFHTLYLYCGRIVAGPISIFILWELKKLYSHSILFCMMHSNTYTYLELRGQWKKIVTSSSIYERANETQFRSGNLESRRVSIYALVHPSAESTVLSVFLQVWKNVNLLQHGEVNTIRLGTLLEFRLKSVLFTTFGVSFQAQI